MKHVTARDHRMSQYKYLDVLINVFVVILLISNLVAPKLTQLGPFTFSGAQLLFPLTYIFGDIFTEVYGYGGSRRAIWMGFLASALMAVMGLIIVALPPAPGWNDQAIFEKFLVFVPRLVAASLVAYWAGEFANSFVLSRMKLVTNGKHLWMRTIGSTAVGQFVDTILVMTLTFAGTTPWSTIFALIYSGYIAKVLYEAAMTPVTYAVVNALKRAEGVDIYDEGENYNPFAASK